MTPTRPPCPIRLCVRWTGTTLLVSSLSLLVLVVAMFEVDTSIVRLAVRLLVPLLIVTVALSGIAFLFSAWLLLLRTGGWYGGMLAVALVPITAGGLWLAFCKDDWLRERNRHRVDAALKAIAQQDPAVFASALRTCAEACVEDATLDKLAFHTAAYGQPDMLADLLSVAAPAHPSHLASDDALLPPAPSCRGAQVEINTLQLAVLSPDRALLETLLPRADQQQKDTALASAVAADRPEAMALLVAAGADAAVDLGTLRGSLRSLQSRSLIELAIESGSPASLDRLLDAGPYGETRARRLAETKASARMLELWTAAATDHEGVYGDIDRWMPLLPLLLNRSEYVGDLRPESGDWVPWSPIEDALRGAAPLTAQALAAHGLKGLELGSVHVRDAGEASFWPCMFQPGGLCAWGIYPIHTDDQRLVLPVLRDDRDIYDRAVSLAKNPDWLAERAASLAARREGPPGPQPCLEKALEILRSPLPQGAQPH